MTVAINAIGVTCATPFRLINYLMRCRQLAFYSDALRMQLIATYIQERINRGRGRSPQTIKCYGFSINKRLLTVRQFTTNVSTRSIFRHDTWKALKYVSLRDPAPSTPAASRLGAIGASNPIPYPTLARSPPPAVPSGSAHAYIYRKVKLFQV